MTGAGLMRIAAIFGLLVAGLSACLVWVDLDEPEEEMCGTWFDARRVLVY